MEHKINAFVIVSVIAFNIFKFIGVSAKGFGYNQPLNI